MHPLLKHQLNKLEFNDRVPKNKAQWAELLKLVQRKYRESDLDHQKTSASLEICFKEMSKAFFDSVPGTLFLITRDLYYLSVNHTNMLS